MITLSQIAAELITAHAECLTWSKLVKDLALSESPELPPRIAEAQGIGTVDKTTGRPVSPAHLRQIIVSRMEAADREFHVLYNAQLELVASGRMPAQETEN